MTAAEQRDWIWKRYEDVRDFSYDMANADAERLTREAAAKLLEAHRALIEQAKTACRQPVRWSPSSCQEGRGNL